MFNAMAAEGVNPVRLAPAIERILPAGHEPAHTDQGTDCAEYEYDRLARACDTGTVEHACRPIDTDRVSEGHDNGSEGANRTGSYPMLPSAPTQKSTDESARDGRAEKQPRSVETNRQWVANDTRAIDLDCRTCMSTGTEPNGCMTERVENDCASIQIAERTRYWNGQALRQAYVACRDVDGRLTDPPTDD